MDFKTHSIDKINDLANSIVDVTSTIDKHKINDKPGPRTQIAYQAQELSTIPPTPIEAKPEAQTLPPYRSPSIGHAPHFAEFDHSRARSHKKRDSKLSNRQNYDSTDSETETELSRPTVSPDTPTLPQVRKAKAELALVPPSRTTQAEPSAVDSSTRDQDNSELFENDYDSGTRSIAESTFSNFTSSSSTSQREENLQKWISHLRKSSKTFAKPTRRDGRAEKIADAVFRHHAEKRITNPEFAIELKLLMIHDINSRLKH